MPDPYDIALMHHIHNGLLFLSLVIGVFGVGVITWGVIISGSRFVVNEWRGLYDAADSERRYALRHFLGYYLLLGLEFLVAADIIATVAEPNLPRLGILAAIVLIRTIVSIGLHWELERSVTPPAPKKRGEED